MKETIIEAYMGMLTESPYLNYSDTPQVLSDGSVPIRTFIHNNHSNTTSLGNNQFHMKHLSGADIYYHTVNDTPVELSFISKNIQTGVEKSKDGNSTHLHDFMRHHVDKTGELKSSNSNTKGSRNLWVNFIKKNPDLKFHSENTVTKDKKKLNANNIDAVSPSLWGTDKTKHSNIIIVAKK